MIDNPRPTSELCMTPGSANKSTSKIKSTYNAIQEVARKTNFHGSENNIYRSIN